MKCIYMFVEIDFHKISCPQSCNNMKHWCLKLRLYDLKNFLDTYPRRSYVMEKYHISQDCLLKYPHATASILTEMVHIDYY